MKRLVSLLALAAICLLVLVRAVPTHAAKSDEAEIKALEDRFAAAVKAKDINAIMAVYAPGDRLLVFDVVPPRQYEGADAYKKDWQQVLTMLAGPVEMTISDLSVMADGKMAYSHSIQHVSSKQADGSAFDLVVRVTDVYEKIGGKWLIVHEHVSVPVDLATGKADLSSKP